MGIFPIKSFSGYLSESDIRFFIEVNMIFVFRNIVYDSTLIHQYESESDDVRDLPIKVYSPHEFSMWLSDDYGQYNYVYLPHNGRYYYMDILEYRNNTIHVKFTCDYGRTFGEIIGTDFLMCEDSLDEVQTVRIPTGGHIMSEEYNILYFPRSARRLNKSDADNVISLIKSGIVLNFEDYEPESYTPEPPSEDTPSEDNAQGLQPVDPIELMNQPE